MTVFLFDRVDVHVIWTRRCKFHHPSCSIGESTMGVHFALGGCAVSYNAVIGTMYVNAFHNVVSLNVYTAQLV